MARCYVRLELQIFVGLQMSGRGAVAGRFPSPQSLRDRSSPPGWRVVQSKGCLSVPHHLPQEVSGSRWEVMELCGSGGGDMTSCQALMQANIWRLWATLFLACWQGPLAWSQKPPPGAGTGAWETVSSSSNAEWQHSDFHCEERKRSGLTGSPLCVLYTGHRENANASK